MAYKAVKKKAFLEAAEKLGRNARIALPYAIDGILDSPNHLERRHRRPDGAIVDYNNEGLLIAFRLLDAELVEFLEVADVKKEHRWP